MAKDVQRPYFKHSIDQLEGLFTAEAADPRVLSLLAHELKFRSTDRAARLRDKIAQVGPIDPPPPASPRVPDTVLRPESTNKPVSVPTENRERSPAGRTAQSMPSRTAPIPETINFGDLRSAHIPKGANEPAAILAAWIALEALSPQTYRRPEDLAAGDRSCVANLSAGRLPWQSGETSRPKRQLYYQIILGAVPMDLATAELVRAFGEDEERSTRLREKAAIAAILVDRDGLLLEENGIAVSSFAWALPLALKLKLGALGAWPRIEPKIIEKLNDILRRVDDDGNAIPLDLLVIEGAFRWLVTQLGLPSHLAEAPSFAIRVYHYFKAKNPPEATLLNSFFLGDLARAVSFLEAGRCPAGLKRYLGIDKPPQIFDLLSDRAALEKSIAPAIMPAARWPSKGGHPLVLLQQSAVNLTRSKLAQADGIIAVNGPPGTGKTTLLRDVVAACVLDRALAMAAFDSPEKAFMPSGEKVPAGEKAFFHLYSLAPSLKGHEVLVASSNNKAVENISRELPSAKEIGRPIKELNYFKSVSDVVHGPLNAIDLELEEESHSLSPEPVTTWGLIAAVLGNAKNRAAFQQSFWWHEDFGFRLYLKAAKGDSVIREIKDPVTGKITERRTPGVVTSEQPPAPQLAQENWRRAKEKLLVLKREIDAELEALERIRKLCLHMATTKRQVADRETRLDHLTVERALAEAQRAEKHGIVLTAKRNFDQHAGQVEQHLTTRPGLLARLFRTARWKAWAALHAPLVQASTRAVGMWKQAEHDLAKAQEILDGLISEIRSATEQIAHLKKEAAQLSEAIDKHRPSLEGRVIDEQFFEKSHESSNLAAPWMPDSLHRKREELFIAALSVHRSFIGASAQKVLHNLSILMDVFSGGPPQDEAKRKLLGDLWSTLFMVVPVLSTTFASVERMLGDLPEGSIGWLMIDEAGQALPQAAVGAILRARRSVVVGDPLQIPPVVALPERLNAEICKYFKIDQPIWAAPDASAQTLADQASEFQAAFRSDRGPRRVGIPLLVHRRCQEPMFGFSNRIAYDGQMVHAAGQPEKAIIEPLLGPSTWFDIDGDAESKWCPEEGEFAVSLLRKIAAAGIVKPDLFIITPFRIVAQELRRRLERETALFAAFGIDAREWLTDRVGTIHTVQGREAEAVILVLGAPKASQNGARNWAAATPNILNVAVSRAKQALYVIGSHGAWSGVGHAREVGAMPRRRV